MSTLRFILFFLLVIIQSGCVEHSLTLTVLSEDKILIDYSMQGDRIDMEDGLTLLPDSTKWNSTRSVEENDDETVHIFKSSIYIDSFTQLNSALDWSVGAADSVFLTRSLAIEVKDFFLGKSYTFTCEYPSRNYSQNYGDIWEFIPPECRILEDDDQVDSMTSHEVELLEKKYALGLIQWNRQRYENRFNKVWKNFIEGQPEFESIPQTSFSIAMAGWKDDLRLHMNSIDVDNPDLLNLEWWAELKPLFLGRFADLIGSDRITLVEQISESMDKKYKISRDLDDEEFELKLLLPGKVIQTDGVKGDADNVLWTFTGKELMENDIHMNTYSIKPSFQKIGLTILCLLLIIGFVWKSHGRTYEK